MQYLCCDERRRAATVAHATMNGIDFLEVDDDPTQPPNQRQLKLYAHFLKPLAPGGLAAANVRITGGERIMQIDVTGASIGTGDQANVLTVTVASPGDFSPYLFRLVDPGNDAGPPTGFDPILSQVTFSFKAACESDLDCAPNRVCVEQPPTPPEIDYLAKDYATFRQAMLDRMAVTIPAWTERNPADLGVALVETLAYVADHLSYRQDAVATEAYLGTARRRVSARRHARLVDYFMHDGCSARAWVHVNLSHDVVLPAHTPLYSRVPGAPQRMATGSKAQSDALALNPVIFETMAAAGLFAQHDELAFYAWGDRECCLPVGATRATLRGALPDLNVGDTLLFEEVMGPKTGVPAEADPTHRCVVRLTEVTASSDPLGGRFDTPPTDNTVAITEIAWHPADALPFPLCISSLAGTDFYPAVSVARGNLVLADYGATAFCDLGPVPAPSLGFPVAAGSDRCAPSQPEPVPVRFRPEMPDGPVTQAAVGPAWTSTVDTHSFADSAASAMVWSAAQAIPAIELSTDSGAAIHPDTADYQWQPALDLLECEPSDTRFVVEVESDGSARLRFGDGVYGLRPPTGTTFYARYRIGAGAAGNVGPEAIAHVVFGDSAVTYVRNPLAAIGGVEPESIEQVRRYAPSAFMTQERAVTPDDYARMAERHTEVQRAAATMRWTGSWHTLFVSVDRTGGVPVDDAFRVDLRAFLERYRMVGHDLEIDDPRFVSLEIEMHVCVLPDYIAAHVKSALLDVFSSGRRMDGSKGFFHPDNFTFGQPVYLSPIVAAAQNTEGVQSVEVTVFQRQGVPDPAGLALSAGRLDMDRLEVARLENDPSYAEHGVFRLKVEGGR